MDIVDIMFHIHPDLSAEQRTRIEETISADEGVMSVHFSPYLLSQHVNWHLFAVLLEAPVGPAIATGGLLNVSAGLMD